MLATTKTTTCTNLPGRLLTTASNDKKLFKNPSLTTLEAGSGLDGYFNSIQAVVAAGSFADDMISVH